MVSIKEQTRLAFSDLEGPLNRLFFFLLREVEE